MVNKPFFALLLLALIAAGVTLLLDVVMKRGRSKPGLLIVGFSAFAVGWLCSETFSVGPRFGGLYVVTATLGAFITALLLRSFMSVTLRRERTV